MNTIHLSQLNFFAGHSPFDRMEQAHLMWMLEHMQLANYASDEVITSPQQGQALHFYVIKQGLVCGTRVADAQQDTLLELHEGECFPVGALLARRAVTSEYRAAKEVICFKLNIQNFHELIEMSVVFKDFCSQRLAHLFEQSRRAIQTQYVQSASDQQSMSSQLSSLIRRNPVSCSPDTPLRQVLETMDKNSIGSMVVVDKQNRPVGIFTLHDALSRIMQPGLDQNQPVSAVMTPKPYSITPQSFAYEAALAMAKYGFRHILITENGQLRGMISEKDLFSLQRVGLHQISSTIRIAENIDALKVSASDIRQLSRNMLAQGIAAEQLIQIISTLNDLLASRIIELELRNSPVKYIDFCWIALGSEGRFERTLGTGQNNGLIFSMAEGEHANTRREIMIPFAKRVNLALAECGFPLGNADATDIPQWCLSLDEWKATFANWIDHADPDALHFAASFFDFRPLYGAEALAVDLRDWVLDETRKNTRFLHQMAVNALQNSPPLGLVRDFVTGDKHTLDLKLNGITPFIDAARILSLSNDIGQTNTASRLRELADRKIILKQNAETWIDAFLFIQLLRLRLHHEQEEKGIPLTNKADPDKLKLLDRRILKEAFRQTRKLQSQLKLIYQI